MGPRYGQAHAVQANVQDYEATTIAALANFATSTAADRAALSKLTDTVQELTAELKAAREKIDDLQQQLSNAKRGKRGGGKETRTQGKSITASHVVTLPITQANFAQGRKRAIKMRHIVWIPWADQQIN